MPARPRAILAAVPKVPFDPDKKTWHPSVLPGQVVLVSTVDGSGQANVAPKNWVTMAAFGGPIVAFGCTGTHRTLRNVEETGEFVINVATEPLVDRVWALVRHHGAERLRRSGFTLVPARQVRPPLVDECPAHLECRLDDVKRYGAEAFVFGRIVAAEIDRDRLAGLAAQQYFRLRPVFFLEGSTYGSIDTAKRVGNRQPSGQQLFVIEIGACAGAPAAAGHTAFLHRLRGAGLLLAAGPHAPDPGGDGPAATYVVGTATAEEAGALAREDPLVRAGASFTLRAWTRSL